MTPSPKSDRTPHWLEDIVADLFSFVALSGFMVAITIWALIFVGGV